MSELVELNQADRNIILSDVNITITERALRAAVSALQGEEDKDQHLRIGCIGGGCSGFKWTLNFTNEIDPEDDRVFGLPDLNLVIDIFSLEYLKGVTLDHVNTLQESGFKFNAPHVKKTCGCGQSFSV